jgi:hypothetical protein
VGGGYRDTTLSFFRGIIYLIIGPGFTTISLCLVRGYRCGQRRLTVINVADGANVNVRLIPLKFFFGHNRFPLLIRKHHRGQKIKFRS